MLVPAERADALVSVTLPGGAAQIEPVGDFPHNAAAATRADKVRRVGADPVRPRSDGLRQPGGGSPWSPVGHPLQVPNCPAASSGRHADTAALIDELARLVEDAITDTDDDEPERTGGDERAPAKTTWGRVGGTRPASAQTFDSFRERNRASIPPGA